MLPGRMWMWSWRPSGVISWAGSSGRAAPPQTPVCRGSSAATQIPGILRGLLRDGYPVTPGFKVADVDPRRSELENCFLISDKARCIAGSVLELIAAECWK